MKQLVQPNLSVVGYRAYCLKYADYVAGLSGGEQTAWIAWNNTQFPHTDAIPSDVAVPCWFSYYSGTINLGHVVWSVPGKGFYSSPHTNAVGHDVMQSIAEVERLYGVKYVGWSEDISRLKVVEGGDMTATKDEVIQLYQQIVHHNPTDDQIAAQIANGNTPMQVASSIQAEGNQQEAAQQADIAHLNGVVDNVATNLGTKPEETAMINEVQQLKSTQGYTPISETLYRKV